MKTITLQEGFKEKEFGAESLAEFVKYYLSKLPIDGPLDIRFQTATKSKFIIIEIISNNRIDRAKIIGKGGKNIHTLRKLCRIIAQFHNPVGRCDVQIIED